MYNDNPFHSFGHACHMAQSVLKLMSRITSAEHSMPDEVNDHDVCSARQHELTFGIASDPLTQFACVFAALIHDVDHSGVPNSQLVKEGAPVATLYQAKSAILIIDAEQSSK